MKPAPSSRTPTPLPWTRTPTGSTSRWKTSTADQCSASWNPQNSRRRGGRCRRSTTTSGPFPNPDFARYRPRGAEILFQVLTEREEKNYIAIASNESFSGWPKTFTDPRLCAAIVDRLTFNAVIENRHRLLPPRSYSCSARTRLDQRRDKCVVAICLCAVLPPGRRRRRQRPSA